MNCTCALRPKDEGNKKPKLFYCSEKRCRVGALEEGAVVQKARVGTREYVFCSEPCYLKWLSRPLFYSATSSRG